MKIYNNITELIGKTPLIKINKLNDGYSNILAKVEYFNPTGSIKDRTAYYLIKDALDNGIIKKGDTIIEPTSGNTGIGLALCAIIFELNLILTMPDTMSKERIAILKAYNAKIVLTEGKLGMQGAIDKANELSKEIKNSFIPQQFNNKSNTRAHFETTAQEIIDDTEGKIDYLVATIGTSGTIIGIAEKLKEFNENIKIIGVEPQESPLLSKGYSNQHKIQGIGANFVPQLFEKKLIDEILTVNYQDSIKTMKDLAQKEGLFCGISSGAAMKIALDISKKEKDKNIIVIFPDGGTKYLSCEVF